jgi:hypothetical protein
MVISSMVSSSPINIITRAEPVINAGPKILWPTMVLAENGNGYVEGDLEGFPEEDNYRIRANLGIGGAMSRAFKDAVRAARRRVWLLDEYLLGDDKSGERLWELFYDTGASDLRVVTSSKEGAEARAKWLKELEPDLQKRTFGTPPKIKIYLNFKSMKDLPEVHDRFAVIDDVLWHCGSTVGGLHYAINAMTFGWSVQQTRAEKFFLRVCDVLGENDDRTR